MDERIEAMAKALWTTPHGISWENAGEDDRDLYRKKVTRQLANLASYAVVPVEPTPKMEAAAFDVWEVDYDRAKECGFGDGTDVRNHIYRAMIAAAGEPS